MGPKILPILLCGDNGSTCVQTYVILRKKNKQAMDARDVFHRRHIFSPLDFSQLYNKKKLHQQ